MRVNMRALTVLQSSLHTFRSVFSSVIFMDLIQIHFLEARHPMH